MIITVFGGGVISEEEYQQALKLGEKIAKKGYTLKNGGYGGTMEAVSKGCCESKGTVIGICVKGHPFSKTGKPNEYLTEIMEEKTLHERLKKLLETDVIIILPGSIGTLGELFISWAESIAKEKLSQKAPVIYLVGEKNKKLLNFLKDNGFINAEYLKHIRQLDTINSIEILN